MSQSQKTLKNRDSHSEAKVKFLGEGVSNPYRVPCPRHHRYFAFIGVFGAHAYAEAISRIGLGDAAKNRVLDSPDLSDHEWTALFADCQRLRANE